MQVSKISSITPGNVFLQEPIAMGVQVNANLMVMTFDHQGDETDSVVLVNPRTGERCVVHLTDRPRKFFFMSDEDFDKSLAENDD